MSHWINIYCLDLLPVSFNGTVYSRYGTQVRLAAGHYLNFTHSWLITNTGQYRLHLSNDTTSTDKTPAGLGVETKPRPATDKAGESGRPL